MRIRVIGDLCLILIAASIGVGSPEAAVAGESRRVVAVKFNLPDRLPKKRWRGNLPSFAFVRPFNLTQDGWADIQFLQRDARWSELAPEDLVVVELQHESCSPAIHLQVPKKDLEGNGRPINIRPDEAESTTCGATSRECSIEVLEAGSRRPVEGVSIVDRGLLGKTGVDGRWLGTRARSQLSAQLIGKRYERFSFESSGRRKDEIEFCRRGSPDHEVFYVIPTEVTGENDRNKRLVIFRPSGSDRYVAGVDLQITFDDSTPSVSWTREGPDVVSFDPDTLFAKSPDPLPAKVKIGSVFEIPVNITPSLRDLTPQVKKKLRLGMKGCRINLSETPGLNTKVFERGAVPEARAFGARLKLSPSGSVFVPQWLVGLGARVEFPIHVTDATTRRPLGVAVVSNVRSACAGERTALSWREPLTTSSSWPVRVSDGSAANLAVEGASVYVSAVRTGGSCDLSRRELWAGQSDASGQTAIGSAAARLVEGDGLCICADYLGRSGCAFGTRGSVHEVKLSADGPQPVRIQADFRLPGRGVMPVPRQHIYLCAESPHGLSSSLGLGHVSLSIPEPGAAISLVAWVPGLSVASVSIDGRALAKNDQRIFVEAQLDLSALASAWLRRRMADRSEFEPGLRAALERCEDSSLSSRLDEAQLEWNKSYETGARVSEEGENAARAIVMGRLAQRSIAARRAFSNIAEACPKILSDRGASAAWGQGSLHEMVRALVERSPRPETRLEMRVVLLTLLVEEISGQAAGASSGSSLAANLAAACVESSRPASDIGNRGLRACSDHVRDEMLATEDPFLILLWRRTEGLLRGASGADLDWDTEKLVTSAMKDIAVCGSEPRADRILGSERAK